jgi:hypothetical protein
MPGSRTDSRTALADFALENIQEAFEAVVRISEGSLSLKIDELGIHIKTKDGLNTQWISVVIQIEETPDSVPMVYIEECSGVCRTYLFRQSQESPRPLFIAARAHG